AARWPFDWRRYCRPGVRRSRQGKIKGAKAPFMFFVQPRCLIRRERMFRDIALRGDIGGSWLAVDGARDRLLGGLIVEVLNLLVVLGVPMDEHADANEQIVGFAHRNNAGRDA